MGRADRETLRFQAVAYSGLTVIAWNNFFFEDELPIGYVPMPGIEIEIEGERFATDDQGRVSLPRQRPGSLTVAVPQENLPPGLEVLEPGPQSVELHPGQDTLFPLAVRGYAMVSGKVELRGGLTLPPQGVGLLVQGREIGRTEPDGRFEIRVPTGRVELQAATAELGRRAFQVSPVTLVLSPGDRVERTLAVSMSGSVTFRLLLPEGSETRTRSLLEAIPVIRGEQDFLYTDAEGWVRFEGLHPGRHRFEVPKDSLPEEVQVDGSGIFLLDLDDGEERTLDVPLLVQPRRP